MKEFNPLMTPSPILLYHNTIHDSYTEVFIVNGKQQGITQSCKGSTGRILYSDVRHRERTAQLQGTLRGQEDTLQLR